MRSPLRQRARRWGIDVDVRALQTALNAHGANPSLTVDGDFGPLTTAAVKAFQASHGLTVDGLVGPQTMAALGLSGQTTTPGVLRAAVVQKLPSIFGQWEGSALPYMYTDSKGYVTTGTGNLIDSVAAAQALPWQHAADGSLASPDEVASAWQTVKDAWPGVQSTASASLTDLRLSPTAIHNLVMSTVQSMYTVLRQEFPGFDNYPADAQLAILSVSWAWGPGFPSVWDKVANGAGTAFKKALSGPRPDFVKAADIMKTASKHEESINPGIIPRNTANAAMLSNAQNVLVQGLDFDTLFYPNLVPKAAGWGVLGFGLAFLAYRLLKAKGVLG